MFHNVMKDNRVVDNQDDDEREILEWMTHPLRRKPLIATIVTIFIFTIGFIVYYMTVSKAFTTLALVVLFASLTKFYFPTKFRLTDKKITIKTTTQTISKDWSIYRSYYPDNNGILLSPFANPSRLENFRGMYLIFADNKEDVVRFVKTHINKTIKDRSNSIEKNQ